MPGLPSPPGSKEARLSLGLIVSRGLVKSQDFHYYPVVMRLHFLWRSRGSGGGQAGSRNKALPARMKSAEA